MAAERFALRVVKGGFAPADSTTSSRLRMRAYRTGDLVFAEFRKPRNPGFHRLAHQLGLLCAENLDAFTGMDPHAVLKRLQLESGVGCDEMMVSARSIWPPIVKWIGENIGEPFAVVMQSALDAIGAKATMIPVFVPRSLSYESMDDGKFHEVMHGLCQHLASEYWPDCTPEQVESMASCMVDTP